MSAAHRQAARVLGPPIVTEPDPLPHGGIGRTCRSDSDGEVYEQSVTGWCPVPPTRERLTLAGHHAGAVYLDPADGELVQVLPASAWREDRWGPPRAVPVVRVLVPGKDDPWTTPGEVAQRDLAAWTRVPERVLEALRAGAGADGEAGISRCKRCRQPCDVEICGLCFGMPAPPSIENERGASGVDAPRRYSSGDVECSHCRGALANGPDGLCAGCRVGLAISGVDRFLTVTPDDPAHRADGLRCGSCRLDHVRLYRDYGCFLRKHDLRCNACLKSTSSMVPCVSAPDGTVWGYSSCPEEDIARWYARPDASTSEGAPRWDRGDGEPEGWRVRREPIEPRAAALHACLVCGRHPATHRAGGEDERCQACGLGDEREGGR